MTPAAVSGAAQTLSLFSHAKSLSSPRRERATPPLGADAAKDGTPVTVDTVSISSESRQAVTDVKKEEAAIEGVLKEKVKKEQAATAAGGKSDRAAARVQFVYDQNGELSIRYMDSADRLVYQSPSELMKQMREAAAKSDSSVDTKA